MVSVLFAVNRMNKLLNENMTFDKNQVLSLKTSESKTILPDTFVFSSAIPGFMVKESHQPKIKRYWVAEQALLDLYKSKKSGEEKNKLKIALMTA